MSQLTRINDEVAMLEQQYNDRVEVLKGKVRQTQASEIGMKILSLQALQENQKVWQDQAQTKIDALRAEAQKCGIVSVEVEMLRVELENQELMLRNLNIERDTLDVEVRSPSRINLWQPAEEEKVPSNTIMRVALTFLASVAGFFCPAIVIVLWDTRLRRINTAEDVSKGLSLPVIGSIPLIPPRVIRRLDSPAPRYRAWNMRLTESVDGITARMLHKAETEQCRVIMVSSANAGEGKTTLATQLSLSLARGGRRTVIVDFDLRCPAFDEVFGVPLSPGVCEWLRHETDVAELIHATATENLSLVSAGQWDRRTIAALSNGGAAELIKRLRGEFDFVIVDTSPLLPVADARFVSRFVDTVVLSVFRDISQAPNIQAACEILTAFGVYSVEAVVTGPNHHVYGKHIDYEAMTS